MPRTYHFMGWNRDRDAEAPFSIAPLELTQCIDEASAISPAVRDAMTAAVIVGTGVVRMGVDLARHGAERAVIQRGQRRRWYGQPMLTLKDDDPQITWDDKDMAARPFRERTQ